MKRTIKITVTLDMYENNPYGLEITPIHIARELVKKDVEDLFVYEEGFQDLVVEVTDDV